MRPDKEIVRLEKIVTRRHELGDSELVGDSEVEGESEAQVEEIAR